MADTMNRAIRQWFQENEKAVTDLALNVWKHAEPLFEEYYEEWSSAYTITVNDEVWELVTLDPNAAAAEAETEGEDAEEEDYELLSLVLMILGIIVSLLIAYINQSKK